jgi:hypothetical protein
VFRWPVREALLAFLDHLKKEAVEQYRHECLMWAVLNPHRKKSKSPPNVPAILKESPDGDA